jgi:hypothetical protein
MHESRGIAVFGSASLSHQRRESADAGGAASRLNLSVPAFKSQLHRLRQRYQELLLDEVSQTVGVGGDATDELRGY